MLRVESEYQLHIFFSDCQTLGPIYMKEKCEVSEPTKEDRYELLVKTKTVDNVLQSLIVELSRGKNGAL